MCVWLVPSHLPLRLSCHPAVIMIIFFCLCYFSPLNFLEKCEEVWVGYLTHTLSPSLSASVTHTHTHTDITIMLAPAKTNTYIQCWMTCSSKCQTLSKSTAATHNTRTHQPH